MRYEDFSDLHVAEVMSRWPATIGVFIRLRMHCIGCPIGQFHTLADAAEEHRLSLDDLSSAIAAAVEAPASAGTGGRYPASGSAPPPSRSMARWRIPGR